MNLLSSVTQGLVRFWNWPKPMFFSSIPLIGDVRNDGTAVRPRFDDRCSFTFTLLFPLAWPEQILLAVARWKSSSFLPLIFSRQSVSYSSSKPMSISSMSFISMCFGFSLQLISKLSYWSTSFLCLIFCDYYLRIGSFPLLLSFFLLSNVKWCHRSSISALTYCKSAFRGFSGAILSSKSSTFIGNKFYAIPFAAL